MTSPAEVSFFFFLLSCWKNECTFSCEHQRLPSAPLHASLGSGRTLRETVLESSPVLALLNQSFISSWSLVRELENMQVSREAALPLNHPVDTSRHTIRCKCALLFRQADGQNLPLSEKARLHLEKYSFPVEMMVALPNGTVVSWVTYRRGD